MGVYASLIYLIISFRAGLFPYIRSPVRKILAPAHMQRITDTARIVRLRTICQVGMTWAGSLIMAVTGAVRGKRVSTVEATCSGYTIISEPNQSGIIAGTAKIPDQP